jgi:hypothetical protein
MPGIIGSAGRDRCECLDLGLLIDAEHQGRIGRVHLEPDDVVDLLHE